MSILHTRRLRTGLTLATLAFVGACSSNDARPPRNGANGGAGNGSGNGGSGNSGGISFNLDSGVGGGNGLCDLGGLACQIQKCDGAGQVKTSVRAKIYDPAGQVPLYNVVVYVNNQPVDPITDGPTCDTCATPVSGQPIASALTDATGEFVMQDVPVGKNIPLVIQVGKWRRQIALPEVKACQENAFDDPTLLRLPKNSSEGHIPKIAISTGEADSLECLMRRIGVDATEFTNPDGAGRINLFQTPCSSGTCDPGDSAYASGGTFPQAWNTSGTGTLWDHATDLQKYDIVMMSCTGSQSAGRDVTTAQKGFLKSYVDAGGRAFLEHYHYSWLRGTGQGEGPNIDDTRKYPAQPTPPAGFPLMATWDDETNPDTDHGNPKVWAPYSVDTSFPKGNDFADWLVNVQASTARGTVSLFDVKNPAYSTSPPTPAIGQSWIVNASGALAAAPFITWNTPLEKPVAQQCGRVVHNGIHVAVASNDVTKSPFPSGCTVAALTPQEKVLEFLLFELSSCVEDVHSKPTPPPPVH